MTNFDTSAAKKQACASIDALAEVLINASHEIHANPELNFKEHHAHDLLTSVLESNGLETQRAAYGLDTAFEARAGSQGPVIAVLCEYDALPDIGHACGHNIIATAGLGAGLVLAPLAEQLGGQLRVLGTPAEEGGGGKVLMLQRGAFVDVNAAMMVHPAGSEVERITSLAIEQLEVRYTGKASHAAAAPEKGINALDGAVLGYNNIAALRQHIAPDERIHGIFTDGPAKANIVPHHAGANWYMRSPTRAGLAALKDRVVRCLEAGALAAGCTMEYTWVERPYDDVIDSRPLLEAYIANAQSLGRDPRPESETAIVGSTDMGNVSYAVPSIHPMIKVAPEETAIHTVDFEQCAGGPQGDQGVIDGAKAMAMTVIDCWTKPEILADAETAFLAAGGVRASGFATT
ncbi:MAG: M20 family metallopeptidase [Actinobacteria bacterium]|jgi:amidohydrolase|nr:M20 family metallopeptidase [Actinomycetota bacterium]MBT3746651.1 M20 family metallopeptidase [Actinomycetota bacterium]MBT3969556.1 M20 family metallopeptidase [Actinomycetota bacterium]MBT4010519.1 M20 family metallopeptidase [Actinomycetota bacterium]MBT4303360.1 M20 family metallopeptidase [Actinomycetota bacterium]